MGGGSWWKVRAGCTLFLGEISQVRCSGAKRVTGQKGRGLRGSEGRGYVLFFFKPILPICTVQLIQFVTV